MSNSIEIPLVGRAPGCIIRNIITVKIAFTSFQLWAQRPFVKYSLPDEWLGWGTTRGLHFVTNGKPSGNICLFISSGGHLKCRPLGLVSCVSGKVWLKIQNLWISPKCGSTMKYQCMKLSNGRSVFDMFDFIHFLTSCSYTTQRCSFICI